MHLRNLLVTLAGAVLAFGCGGGSTSGSDAGPAKMSQLGESCSRSADCDGDLICVSQQCVSSGTTTTAPKVSGRGETCTASADCATGLVCWGVLDGTAPYAESRCDYASFGIAATGKTCSAECVTNADCMEIPLPDQPGTSADGGSTNFRSCQDLTAAIGGIGCTDSSPHQRECFLHATYCSSTSNPWTCTNGTCAYTATCTPGNGPEVVGGCPAYTRSGTALSYTTCNSANKCAASSVTGCTSDANCDGKAVADEPGDTCSTGECVCHATSGGCYRRCKNNLECAEGFVCGSAQYCVAADTCDTDAFCAVSTKRASAKCVSGACKVPCALDLECSPSGLFSPGFNGQVCHAGYCESVGCASDSECFVGSGVRTFCVTPPAAAATAAPHSAITN